MLLSGQEGEIFLFLYSLSVFCSDPYYMNWISALCSNNIIFSEITFFHSKTNKRNTRPCESISRCHILIPYLFRKNSYGLWSDLLIWTWILYRENENTQENKIVYQQLYVLSESIVTEKYNTNKNVAEECSQYSLNSHKINNLWYIFPKVEGNTYVSVFKERKKIPSYFQQLFRIIKPAHFKVFRWVGFVYSVFTQ